MCGIGGVIFLDGREAPVSVLKGMTSLLRHRGPDGQDTYVAGPIGLAHTRLSILDTSERGSQPMSYQNGRYWITYNGEIYNFLEIRDQLKEKKYEFTTETDTEVILAAFSEWGEEAVNKFNGMFAFAIWDAQKKCLQLFRDRLGVKPLYYYFNEKILAFASEIKGFLAIPDIDLVYDDQGLRTVLAYEKESEGLEITAFRSVKKLLPGSTLLIDLQKKRPHVRRWWRLIDSMPDVSTMPKKQIERLRELMFDACHIRMRSDVPIATCLSGGLDSSAVFATVNQIGRTAAGQQRISSDWQTAFIMRLTDGDNEEQNLAEEFARALGANVKLLDDSSPGSLASEMSPDETFNIIRRMTYDFEGIGFLFPAQWQLYKEVRANGMVVTLDGHGADECLAGYPDYAAAYAMDALGAFGSAANTVDGMRGDPQAWEKYDQSFDLNINTDRIRREIKPSPPFEPSWVTSSPTASFCHGQTPPFFPETWEADEEDLAGTDNLFRIMYFRATYGFLQWILRTYDHASMAHGVESRAPFLDPNLFGYALALPPRQKIQKGYGKFILREAMTGLVPGNILNRSRKVGLNVPLGDYLSGPLRNEMNSIINSPAFADGYPWDGRKVTEFIKTAEFPPDQKMKVVLPLVQAHILQDEFREKRSSAMKSLDS